MEGKKEIGDATILHWGLKFINPSIPFSKPLTLNPGASQSLAT
jgi:hypothetical protein